MAKKKKSTSGTLNSISFDKNNRNCMILHFDNDSTHYIAIPPGRNRADIITESKLPFLYTLGFTGLIIITQEDKRLIYLGSKLMFEQTL